MQNLDSVIFKIIKKISFPEIVRKGDNKKTVY